MADGKACFACGYEWPKSGTPAPTPTAPAPTRGPPPSSAAPATAVNTRPNPNPFAPPQRGPMFSPPSTPPPTAAFGAPPLGAFGGAAPFGGTPSTQPLGSAPAQANPFSAPPRVPTPMPRITGVGATGGSIAQMMTNALPHLAPLQAPPAPPPAPPAPPAAALPLIEVPPPAPLIAPVSSQAKKTGEGRGLAALFDDVPIPDAPTIADAANDAGDFMLTPRTEQPPIDPFAEDPALADLVSFHDEPTADLGRGGAPTADLGADLVAAFEAQTSDAALAAARPPAKGGLIAGIDVDEELAALDGLTDASTANMPSPIVVRLRSLAERLRSEGRAADADVITQALVVIEAKSF